MSEDYPGQAYVHKHNANIKRAEEKAMSEQRAGRGEGLAEAIEGALKEASVFCLACAKGEKVVVPPRSSIVGKAAVHSSGMICVPGTVRALIEERMAALEAAARPPAQSEDSLHPPQRGQLLHLADPSNLKAGDAVYVLGEFLRPLDNGMDCEIEFESDQSLHSANVQLSDVCVAALATPSPQAPRKWGAEIAARAEFGDLSPTSAREQSAATASDNLSEGDIADIAMWLDDNLAIEEDAPFERRTELMEKAFRMVIEQAAETGGIAAEAYIENLDDGQVIRAEKCAEKVEDAIRGLKLSVPAATQEQPAGSTLEWLPQVEVIRTELMKRFSDKLSMEEIARCAYSLAGSPRKVGEDGAQPVAFVIETEGGDLYDRGHVIFSDARQAQDRADDLNSELEKESFRVAPLYRALSLSSPTEPPPCTDKHHDIGGICWTCGEQRPNHCPICGGFPVDANVIAAGVAKSRAQASSEIRECAHATWAENEQMVKVCMDCTAKFINERWVKRPSMLDAGNSLAYWYHVRCHGGNAQDLPHCKLDGCRQWREALASRQEAAPDNPDHYGLDRPRQGVAKRVEG